MDARFYQSLYMRRGRRVALLLAGLPFIRMIGLNGSVARGEAKPTSDIDYLIIATPGRLYTVRFFVTLVVQLLGLRRYGSHVAGRICLNRYQTTHHLNVSPHNAYHAEVFSRLIPLVDRGETYLAYQSANQWMTDFGQPVSTPKQRSSHTLLISQLTHRFGEWLLRGRLGDALERILKQLQQRKIQQNPLTARYPDRIVASDDTLLFHPPAPGEVDDDLARWDTAALAYDTLQGQFGDPFRRLVLDPVLFELLGDVRGQQILDAGCGNGYLTNLLTERGATVTGLDGSSVLIARASQNFPGRDFRRANLHQPLDFADNSFDLVVSSMVLQDLADPGLALREFRRILKADGRLIVAISHPCFAYPVGVTKRGWWRWLSGQPPEMRINKYAAPRRVTVALPGLGSDQPTPRYHRTLTDYWKLFQKTGLSVRSLREPTFPDASSIKNRDQSLPSTSIPLILVLELTLDGD